MIVGKPRRTLLVIALYVMVCLCVSIIISRMYPRQQKEAARPEPEFVTVAPGSSTTYTVTSSDGTSFLVVVSPVR